MSEAMKDINFHSQLRKEALQTLRSINASDKRKLEDVLIIFGRKYVRPQSQAKAKHKWHTLTFDPNTKSFTFLLEEVNDCAELAFELLAQQMLDSLLYVKLPPHLRRSKT